MPPGDTNGDAWKLSTEQFRGYVEATLLSVNQKFTEITKTVDNNNKCICDVQNSVNEIKTQLEVNRAIQKLKNGFYGAIGGFTVAFIIQLAKDFLKIKLFGSK
jgi:hypothetical protein